MDFSWFKDIERRVTNMISRGLISKTVEDKKVQRCEVSILKGETLPNVERVQQYGFASFPPSGSQAVLAFVTGSREFPLILSADKPEKRFKLTDEGEVAMYSQYDTHWYLKKDKSIDGKANKLNLVLDTEALIKSPKTVIESSKFAVKAGSDEMLDTILKILAELLKATYVNSAGTPTILVQTPMLPTLIQTLTKFKV